MTPEAADPGALRARAAELENRVAPATAGPRTDDEHLLLEKAAALRAEADALDSASLPHVTFARFDSEYRWPLEDAAGTSLPACPVCAGPVGAVRRYYPPNRDRGLFARAVFEPCGHEALLGYQGPEARP
ncbi:hypothetical protein ACIP93_33885 [Streptomyces sp. NPDC088745]|uniref:hypothetical protein n=1 Tax=Streptomyces sp. NPDC088745 TaxID=3365884 RepID=UPI003829D883